VFLLRLWTSVTWAVGLFCLGGFLSDFLYKLDCVLVFDPVEKQDYPLSSIDELLELRAL
jgi:hypothetical protein